MLTITDYLRYTSWPIIVAMVALMIIGVLAINASQQSDPDLQAGHYTSKQIIFACAGLTVFLLTTVIPYRVFGRLAYPLFAVVMAMLVLVLLVGQGPGDTRRWFNLAIINFQPAEAAKLSYILLLAWYLRFGDHYRRLRGLVLPLVLTLAPMMLILKEPDLGTSLLFLPTLYGMLFMAGARLRHLLSVVALATVVVLLPAPCRINLDDTAESVRTRRALSYGGFNVGGVEYTLTAAPLAVIRGYQAERVEGWLRQGADDLPSRLSYQLEQSKIALGSGGWTGWGAWHEAHGFFRMLPEDHTDFIFAVIGGRWGFVGCMGVLFLYAVILVMGMEIAMVTDDPFGRLLAVGVLALLAAQAMINVGMTLGLTPITGMTLPLVSYGGSSLVINCAALGLLVNVGQRRPILLAPKPFEHGRRDDHVRGYQISPPVRG